jgi:S-adenosylmethionine-dependent methyltransferase
VTPVLDAGCGTGETAIWLANRGNQVVGIDRSEAMLAIAQRQAEQAAVKVDWRVGNIPEDLPHDVFELVVCHNLLGYLAQPAAACAKMAERLPPGGYLSVVVSNALALPLHIAARDGDLKAALRAARGERTKESEACQDTLATHTPQQVRRWLSGAGLRMIRQGAIRTVNDYVPNALKTDEHYPDLLALEKALSENAPYNEIGALTHILATKPA